MSITYETSALEERISKLHKYLETEPQGSQVYRLARRELIGIRRTLNYISQENLRYGLPLDRAGFAMNIEHAINKLEERQ